MGCVSIGVLALWLVCGVVGCGGVNYMYMWWLYGILYYVVSWWLVSGGLLMVFGIMGILSVFLGVGMGGGAGGGMGVAQEIHMELLVVWWLFISILIKDLLQSWFLYSSGGAGNGVALSVLVLVMGALWASSIFCYSQWWWGGDVLEGALCLISLVLVRGGHMSKLSVSEGGVLSWLMYFIICALMYSKGFMGVYQMHGINLGYMVFMVLGMALVYALLAYISSGVMHYELHRRMGGGGNSFLFFSGVLYVIMWGICSNYMEFMYMVMSFLVVSQLGCLSLMYMLLVFSMVGMGIYGLWMLIFMWFFFMGAVGVVHNYYLHIMFLWMGGGLGSDWAGGVIWWEQWYYMWGILLLMWIYSWKRLG